jgi:hypothetical protein
MMAGNDDDDDDDDDDHDHDHDHHDDDHDHHGFCMALALAGNDEYYEGNDVYFETVLADQAILIDALEAHQLGAEGDDGAGVQVVGVANVQDDDADNEEVEVVEVDDSDADGDDGSGVQVVGVANVQDDDADNEEVEVVEVDDSDAEGDDGSGVQVVGVANVQNLAHPRPACTIHLFATTDHRLYCEKCYCLPCFEWPGNCPCWNVHCDKV